MTYKDLTYDARKLLDQEKMALQQLEVAQDNKDPDRYEKLHEWAKLYEECKRRSLPLLLH